MANWKARWASALLSPLLLAAISLCADTFRRGLRHQVPFRRAPQHRVRRL